MSSRWPTLICWRALVTSSRAINFICTCERRDSSSAMLFTIILKHQRRMYAPFVVNKHTILNSRDHSCVCDHRIANDRRFTETLKRMRPPKTTTNEQRESNEIQHRKFIASKSKPKTKTNNCSVLFIHISVFAVHTDGMMNINFSLISTSSWPTIVKCFLFCFSL